VSALAERGVPARRAPVRVADLPSFEAAFVTNSLGVAPVERVDDLALPQHAEFMRTVGRAYESVPWDRI
jgi:branched-subunit amino acid aminotransferase/4-amino-4-deoxychorismate lyase